MIKSIGILAIFCACATTAHSDDLRLTWSDMVFSQDDQGNYIEIPPSVSLGSYDHPDVSIKFAKFADMRRVELHDSFENGDETINVFRVWRGGATVGEQLMLLTTSDQGVTVVGPHPQDFETLKVTKSGANGTPIFALFGADPDVPLAQVEYYDKGLIDLPQ